MPAPSRTIGLADHNMGVNFWLAGIRSDIANQREDLDLFADGDSFVILLFNIEVADCEIAERADGGEPAATELLLAGELLEVLHDFIAAVEDQSPGAFGTGVEEFRFHS